MRSVHKVLRMITVLNEIVVSEIKAEMARRNVTQYDLATRMGKRPEYISRRLSLSVGLSVKDVEQIGAALGVVFLQPSRHLVARRAS